MTLADALREAQAHSPDLQAPTDRVAGAEIQERLARSAFAVKVTPSMSTGTDPIAGATRAVGMAVSREFATGAQATASFSSYAFGLDAARQRDAGYTIGISQPLLRGAGAAARLPVESAAHAVTSADRALQSARATLAVSVATAYFDVVRAEALAAIARDAAARGSRLTVASQARADAGLATELDVLRARLLETEGTAQATAQEEALAAARDRLALLLGRDPAAPIALAEAQDQVALGAPLPDSDEDLVRDALGARPEVADARDCLADARRVAAVSRWNLLPPLSLDATYTRRGLGVPGGAALNALVGGWHVGVTTAYGLDRATERAAVQNADIAVEAASRAITNTERQIEAEIRRLHRSWLQAADTIRLRQETAELARREADLAALRYERGLATSLELVDAEAAERQARMTLADARLNRVLTEIALRSAVGLLDVEGRP